MAGDGRSDAELKREAELKELHARLEEHGVAHVRHLMASGGLPDNLHKDVNDWLDKRG